MNHIKKTNNGWVLYTLKSKDTYKTKDELRSEGVYDCYIVGEVVDERRTVRSLKPKYKQEGDIVKVEYNNIPKSLANVIDESIKTVKKHHDTVKYNRVLCSVNGTDHYFNGGWESALFIKEEAQFVEKEGGSYVNLYTTDNEALQVNVQDCWYIASEVKKKYQEAFIRERQCIHSIQNSTSVDEVLSHLDNYTGVS